MKEDMVLEWDVIEHRISWSGTKLKYRIASFVDYEDAVVFKKAIRKEVLLDGYRWTIKERK